MWRFYSDSSSYWVEPYSVKYGRKHISFSSRKYDAHIIRIASGNSLFTTQNIYLYASIYGSSNLCFVEPLPSDMMMWMDKINDRIEYNSVGDSYYRNIGINA